MCSLQPVENPHWNRGKVWEERSSRGETPHTDHNLPTDPECWGHSGVVWNEWMNELEHRKGGSTGVEDLILFLTIKTILVGNKLHWFSPNPVCFTPGRNWQTTSLSLSQSTRIFVSVFPLFCLCSVPLWGGRCEWEFGYSLRLTHPSKGGKCWGRANTR